MLSNLRNEEQVKTHYGDTIKVNYSEPPLVFFRYSATPIGARYRETKNLIIVMDFD